MPATSRRHLSSQSCIHSAVHSPGVKSIATGAARPRASFRSANRMPFEEPRTTTSRAAGVTAPMRSRITRPMTILAGVPHTGWPSASRSPSGTSQVGCGDPVPTEPGATRVWGHQIPFRARRRPLRSVPRCPTIRFVRPVWDLNATAVGNRAGRPIAATRAGPLTVATQGREPSARSDRCGSVRDLGWRCGVERLP